MKLNDLLCGCVLMSSAAFAQPSNDNCINAEQLCPNLTLSGTTAAATPGSCRLSCMLFSSGNNLV
ncbi:MAG: hypothetical protein IPO32_00075 [Crocinitomicaceae bacterium]|nr:hypothetical protein [Crocinitomicaceae bacterium]